jgi:DNA-binding transcriptional MerR regulator
VRIGELSERSGVPAKTIRFWEQSGVVAEPARTEAGYRDYDEDTLALLRFVRAAQAAGFTLAEIAQIIEIRSRGDAPCEHVTALIDHRLADIDRRMAELRQARTQLRNLAAKADTLDPTRCTDSPVCQIIDDA